MLLLEADAIIKAAPMIEKNQSVFRDMITTIGKGGLSLSNLSKVVGMIGRIKK